DARRHSHRDRLLRRHQAVAAARLAGLAERLALSVAARADGDVHELTEERLLHAADLTLALALGAGDRVRAAASRARVARARVLQLDLLLDSARDFLERKLDAHLEVVAPPRSAARASAAKQVAEAAHVAAEVAH